MEYIQEEEADSNLVPRWLLEVHNNLVEEEEWVEIKVQCQHHILQDGLVNLVKDKARCLQVKVEWV